MARVCLCLSMLLCLADRLTAAEIHVLTAENYHQLAPKGKEVDAIYGDYVLKNDKIVAVVAQPTAWRNANMTTKSVRGGVLDLTAIDAPNDQLTAFYPEARVFKYAEAKIVATGEKVARLQLTAPATDQLPAATLVYELQDDQTSLRVVTTLKNESQAEQTITVQDEVRADNTFDKVANGDTKLWWADDNHFAQAYGLMLPPGSEGKLVTENNGRSSRIRHAKQLLPPGQEARIERILIQGFDRMHVWATAARLRGESVVPAGVVVRDAKGAPITDSWFTVTGPNFTGISHAAGMTAALPPGTYEVSVRSVGHGPAVKTQLKLNPQDAKFVVQDVTLPLAGRVKATITDGRGKPIAAKVEFIGTGGTRNPDFGHASQTFGVQNLRYTPDGKFNQKIDPGSYDVIVSHGCEYDAYFGKLKVAAGRTTPLVVKLPRVVDTAGWVSTDFHSHSSPSGDNTASQLGRVLNLVAEHIEFAPCTEHNRIDTYDPHIKTLGIEGRMATCIGLELTGSPLRINHQNAFPLKRHFGHQDHGAPHTSSNPAEQITRLALWDDRSEKLIQQNHPDLGWMFFDKDADGKPDAGFEGIFASQDVIEVHRTNWLLEMQPIWQNRGKPYNNVAFNWLQLLNQGLRTPIVHNTDAHYNFHGSGGIRNFVKCSTDDPAKIDTMEIVHESEHGHIVLTNGPFLEVKATAGNKSAIPGDDLRAADGNVKLTVRVQCPNWLDIDRVQVLVNGRIDDTLNFTREKKSRGFGDSVVKFERTVDVKLPTDAHLVVLAVHEHRNVGPVMGPNWGSHRIGACANPIFVDVDGGGFKPNGDTLGHPLPVASGK